MLRGENGYTTAEIYKYTIVTVATTFPPVGQDPNHWTIGERTDIRYTKRNRHGTQSPSLRSAGAQDTTAAYRNRGTTNRAVGADVLLYEVRFANHT